ncbi:MAG: endonuclease/exonuclease/phosphatase family protein [Mycobacterium sp.]|nr:endonuclease/exonuclease/phosphatase family protein [Mycobacterium sp.]
MRIATFNILHGQAPGDGAVDPGRLWSWVHDLRPDVLALQEVDLDQDRSGRVDLTAVAAEAMGAVAHRFVAAISGTPGATWIAATGAEQPGSAAYGIALLSRFPASSWQIARLPRIAARFPMYLPQARRVVVVNDEPRAAVIAQLETPVGKLSVANTHLSFVPGWNRHQLRRLAKDLRGLPGPRLLIGDLNLARGPAARCSQMRSLATAATFPADVPKRQLDHILTDHPELRVSRCMAQLAALSDHRPLVVDVEVG